MRLFFLRDAKTKYEISLLPSSSSKLGTRSIEVRKPRDEALKRFIAAISLAPLNASLYLALFFAIVDMLLLYGFPNFASLALKFKEKNFKASKPLCDDVLWQFLFSSNSVAMWSSAV
jgi:hypothetical protein